MCTDCGCSSLPQVSSTAELTPRHLKVHHGLLTKNDRLAEDNRQRFQQVGLLTLNILSSPGSGKTTLIEKTAQRWPSPQKIGTIVGDLATDHDAQRLHAAGVNAVQIMTGGACHLEAEAIAHTLTHLNLDALDLLFIENVGNLVCPAAYDLGEALRVVLLSVTEGEDKPLKYPTAFQSADIVVLTKMDIAHAVGFDRQMAVTNIGKMAPQAQLLEVSARTGTGMTNWLNLLTTQIHTHPLHRTQVAGT